MNIQFNELRPDQKESLVRSFYNRSEVSWVPEVYWVYLNQRNKPQERREFQTLEEAVKAIIEITRDYPGNWWSQRGYHGLYQTQPQELAVEVGWF